MHPHPHRGGDRGAVLVEFGLLLPVLLGVFLGVVTTGLAFFSRLQMTSAAQEGARVLYLGGDAATASSAATAAAAGTVAVTVSGATVPSSWTCPSGGGTTVQVTLTRPMTIRYLIGSTSLTVTARAVTRCG